MGLHRLNHAQRCPPAAAHKGMTIFVKKLTNEILTLEVEPSDTVDRVKELMCDMSGGQPLHLFLCLPFTWLWEGPRPNGRRRR